ncbi:MAG: hypothetical protein R3B99_06800 [Polyangiales bacterium]
MRSRSPSAPATLDRLGGLIQGESLVPLALARASAAAGDRERARDVLERGRRKLAARAARIPRDVWREGFLGHPESLALQNETLD